MRSAMHALLLVVSLVGLASPAAADVTWGIKGGIISASINTSGPGAFGTSADSGGAAGAFVGVALGKGFSFQPEVLLTTRRFSAAAAGTSFSVTTRGIELPLLAHLRVPSNRRWQVVLFAGPQIGFIPSVTQSFGGVDTDIDDDIQNVDVAGILGGGLEIAAGRGALVLDARVTLGLRNVNALAAPAFKSRAMLALVGYRF